MTTPLGPGPRAQLPAGREEDADSAETKPNLPEESARAAPRSAHRRTEGAIPEPGLQPETRLALHQSAKLSVQ